MKTLRALLPLATLAALAAAAPAQLTYNPANGHYYEAVDVPTGITWSAANAAATASGGYLASITSADENAFVYGLFDPNALYSDPALNGNRVGPWFGGMRLASQSSFSWTSGEAFSYTNWYSNQPDGAGGGDQFIQFYNGGALGSTWGDDVNNPATVGLADPRGYIVEYSASPVPEPSALAALGLGAVGLLRRRKRA